MTKPVSRLLLDTGTSGGAQTTGTELISNEVITDYINSVFYVNVTARSGVTGTLLVDIEGFDEVSQVWSLIASFPGIQSLGIHRLEVSPLLDSPIRAVTNVTGVLEPTFEYTCSISQKV